MKTELKNNTLCSPLKLIYLPNGIVAVDEEAEVKAEGYWVYLNPNDKKSWEEMPIKNTLPQGWFDKLHDKIYYKNVIACSPSLNLPILIIPEREDVEEKDLRAFPLGWKKGYRAHAVSHPYSLKDAREIFKAGITYGIEVESLEDVLDEEITSEFEKTMSSLRPQTIWCEVNYPYSHNVDQVINHSQDPEYKFKTNGKELIVIEWE